MALVIANRHTLGFLLRDFRVASCSVEVVASDCCDRQADIRNSTSSHGRLLLMKLSIVDIVVSLGAVCLVKLEKLLFGVGE